jgi:uncharacterized protein YjiS (DUF1127 family)
LHSRETSSAQSPSRRFSLVKALEWLEIRLERRRSRIALLEMTDQQLADIGVSRSAAYREASKCGWF